MPKNRLFHWLLCLLLLVPAPALAQKAPEATAQSLLSAFTAYADLRMGSVQQNLEILASTSEVATLQWERMKPLFSAYQKTDSGLLVWFALPDGTYYTAEKGLIPAKLSDREYFPRLLSGQKILGALVVGRSTGQRSAVVAVPLKRDGKVVGAVGASIFLDKLSDQIASLLALKEGAGFFALAPNGLTTLHGKTDNHFLDPRELGSESLKQAANTILSHPDGEVTYTYEKAAKRTLYRTSALTQWKFALAFPEGSGK